jgi:radical SAM protein with 4Fe4S-binding SPASM domain
MYDGIKNIVALGVNYVAPVIVTDVSWSEEALALLENQAEKVIQYAIDVYNDTNNKRNIAIKLVEDVLENSLTASYNYNVPCAFGGNNYISIGPDGEIMPCHQRHTIAHKYEELKIGNILKDEVNPDKLVGKTLDWYGMNCGGCPAGVICRGWCPSENLNVSEDHRLVPEVICRYNNILYRLIEKYQQEILESPNIRCRKLNVLKFNLEMEQRLLELQKMDIGSPRFLFGLTELYAMLKGNSKIILPSFRENFFLQFKYLLDLLKEVEASA